MALTQQDVANFELVTYRCAEHVAVITLNRPERRNALNFAAYQQLEDCLRFANSDAQARCVIVTGTDPAFCSGDDVVEILGAPPATTSTSVTVRHQITPAAAAALDCEKPLIAAINGAAVGWGMELALYADIRIASERARFAELFIKRGLVCDVGGFYRLPAIVGPAKAAELLFTGEVIDAPEALRIGLVSYMVPHAELAARSLQLARKIAANPPLALRYMKDGLRRAAQGDAREIGAWAIQTIRRLMETEDHREGVASFLEKREPVFRGR